MSKADNYNIYVRIISDVEDIYVGTLSFDSYEEAETFAFAEAIAYYKSLEGTERVSSYDQCARVVKEVYRLIGLNEPTKDDIDNYFATVISNSIVYRAEKVRLN